MRFWQECPPATETPDTPDRSVHNRRFSEKRIINHHSDLLNLKTISQAPHRNSRSTDYLSEPVDCQKLYNPANQKATRKHGYPDK